MELPPYFLWILGELNPLISEKLWESLIMWDISVLFHVSIAVTDKRRSALPGWKSEMVHWSQECFKPKLLGVSERVPSVMMGPSILIPAMLFCPQSLILTQMPLHAFVYSCCDYSLCQIEVIGHLKKNAAKADGSLFHPYFLFPSHYSSLAPSVFALRAPRPLGSGDLFLSLFSAEMISWRKQLLL